MFVKGNGQNVPSTVMGAKKRVTARQTAAIKAKATGQSADATTRLASALKSLTPGSIQG